MTKVFHAGKKGESVRSDCFITFCPEGSEIIDIKVTSKVEALYGRQILELARETLMELNITRGSVLIEDSGALPFTLMARLECAVRRAFPSQKAVSLPKLFEEEKGFASSRQDRLRRSRLYLPGNEPKFFVNAGLHQPDAIILDLEDSVAPEEKDAARILVRNALRSLNFYGAERMVRINQLPLGIRDLEFIIGHNVQLILIPKCEDKEQIIEVEKKIAELKHERKVEEDVWLMPIIESALGVINAYEIAKASSLNVALAVGLEDFTADIGAERTTEGKESLGARQAVVIAARAAQLQPIDTVYSDVANMEKLQESSLEAKALGFDGKGCIHPRQISIINEAFLPKKSEIDKAQKIVMAFEEAKSQGLGVVSLGSKMIDLPVVKRALRAVDLALSTGKIKENWREEIV